MLHVTSAQKKYLAIATFVLLVFGAYFLRFYFSMFFISGVLAFLFWPVFSRIRARRGQGTAVAVTLLLSALAVIIPVVLLTLLAVSQIKAQIDNVSALTSTADLGNLGRQVVNTVNDLLTRIPFVNVTITEESIISTIQSFANSIGSALLNYVRSATVSIASFFTGFIIFVYVYISALRNGEKLLSIFKDINPLGSDISELYITKVAAMIKGTVRGQFIIAVCQGFIGAVSLSLAGVNGFFAVSLIFLSALSVIPLGSGIVLVPVGLIMILFGNLPAGLIILLTHFIVTTNIDTFLKSRLVPPEARLDPALMIVSVFSGISMFGFLGIVIGPTIMIIIVTTVRVYLQVYRDYEGFSDGDQDKDTSGKFLRKIHQIGDKIAGKD